MAIRPLTGLLAIVAAVGGALAFFAGSNLSLAVPAAGLGVVCAAAAAGLVLAGGARIRPPPAPERLADAPVELLDAFQSGRLGRVSIIAAVRRLSRSVDEGRELLSVGEEDRLLEAPEPEFLRWVDSELTRLERAS
ncbi:MAG TPA: hypothetical protein VGU43_04690 [Thermoplasmata archaeon]|nr:hypothetical protein [Thermoplasmata archaeon]